MRLPDEQWLPQAKRCGVNQQSRGLHPQGKCSRRANLVVGNKEDRWWAYCQSCKAGAIVMKSHVLLTSKEPPKSRSLSLPADMRTVFELPIYQQEFLAGFLQSKHMDFQYLPAQTVWSESRHRLLIPTPQGWMGRDTSGRSPEKWLTYNGQHYVSGHEMVLHPNAVLVEDTFSLFKVLSAIRHAGLAVSTYCTLGTRLHDSLFLRCIESHYRVASFYDGDQAGWHGACENGVRLMGVGICWNGASPEACAPKGMDPKDMTIAEIVAHLNKLFVEVT